MHLIICQPAYQSQILKVCRSFLLSLLAWDQRPWVHFGKLTHNPWPWTTNTPKGKAYVLVYLKNNMEGPFPLGQPCGFFRERSHWDTFLIFFVSLLRVKYPGLYIPKWPISDYRYFALSRLPSGKWSKELPSSASFLVTPTSLNTLILVNGGRLFYDFCE